MFVASSSASTVVPPPVSPPSNHMLENSTYTQPFLGTCEICGDVGASGAPYVHCECPDVLYEVHYCGLCIVCGNCGRIGLLCLECGEETGAVYGDPSFPRDVIHTPSTTETVIDDRVRALAIADLAEEARFHDVENFAPITDVIATLPPVPPGGLWAGSSHTFEDHNLLEGVEDDEDDDASFKLTVSHVSSASEVRVRISSGHLNFFARQDIS